MAKIPSKNHLIPPLDRSSEGAFIALANAQSWLHDAEHLQTAGGTPGHVIALATYAEEEAAKAFFGCFGQYSRGFFRRQAFF